MPTASAMVSARMKAVRVTGTDPELQVRQMARRIGLRFRSNVRSLPGRPDLANKKNKWAVFVHGCFWHGHTCKRGKRPKTNAAFWVQKIRTNKLRDKAVDRMLLDRGFRVVTIWQCELKDHDRVLTRLSDLSSSKVGSSVHV